MNKKYLKHKNLNSEHPVFIRVHLKLPQGPTLSQRIMSRLRHIRNSKSLIKQPKTEREFVDKIFITLKNDNEIVLKKSQTIRYPLDSLHRVILKIDVAEDIQFNEILFKTKKKSIVEKFRVTQGKHDLSREINTEIKFRQLVSWHEKDNKIFINSFFGEYYFEKFKNFKLSQISELQKLVVEFFLFGNIEKWFFGEDPNIRLAEIEKYDDESINFKNYKTILSFSMGADSFAAYKLLPRSKRVSYFCHRDYEEYFRADGARVKINPYTKTMENVELLKDVVIIRNNFELMGLEAGLTHGFGHGYAYVIFGILLRDYFQVSSVSVGSVMEQVCAGDGTTYLDHNCLWHLPKSITKPQSYLNQIKLLFQKVGMELSLPTGFMSEVCTNKVAFDSEDTYKGITPMSCPKVDDNGKECGECFKCFRKIRLLGKKGKVTNYLKKILRERPLKTAFTVVYAIKKSNDIKKYAPEYENVDVSYLERYLKKLIQVLLPNELHEDIINKLNYYNIEPMSDEDFKNLAMSGYIFNKPRYRAYKRSKPPKFNGLTEEERRECEKKLDLIM